MTYPVQVHVWHRAEDPEEFLGAYAASRRDLAGTPGLEGLDLLCSSSRPGTFVLVMGWTDLASYQAWERSPAHRGRVSPMRPFQDRRRAGGHYEVYEHHAADDAAAAGAAGAHVPTAPLG